MQDIFEAVVKMKASGEAGALCTIIEVLGSSPQGETSKMLVREDGSILGTIGGGCMEAEVLARAKEVIRTRKPLKETYLLNEKEMGPEGHICGGKVEIYIEPIEPSPRLMVFGCGHVGQVLGRMAHEVGFEVTAVDDRDSFANTELFPFAKAVFATPYEDSLPRLDITKNTYVVIVTRGHTFDKELLGWAVTTPACYIGMIGSNRKVRLTIQNLVKGGLDKSLFEDPRVSAPMGIEIGSVTPGEIAVSILAEMVALRRGALSPARSLAQAKSA